MPWISSLQKKTEQEKNPVWWSEMVWNKNKKNVAVWEEARWCWGLFGRIPDPFLTSFRSATSSSDKPLAAIVDIVLMGCCFRSDVYVPLSLGGVVCCGWAIVKSFSWWCFRFVAQPSQDEPVSQTVRCDLTKSWDTIYRRLCRVWVTVIVVQTGCGVFAPFQNLLHC